jgi:hypothetical protein
MPTSDSTLFAPLSDDIYDVHTSGAGPQGTLPLTEDMLLDRPSGDLFGLTQNAGMGWDPQQLLRDQVLILSTMGGIRAEDGHPIALGYHTGHWEVGLLMRRLRKNSTASKNSPSPLMSPIPATDVRRGPPR